MKRFGLIGYPLGHSFSKKYFTDKFEKEGLTNNVYELFPIDSIEKLPGIIASHPDLCGLNVTIPYKQAVLKYLHELKMPEDLPACNCIRITQGRLEGFNTDAVGFENSFLPLKKAHHTNALVLGNGGATLAVTHVLRKHGIGYQIVSRNRHNSSAIAYQDIDKKIMSNHQIIINTTPVGTFPDVDKYPAIPYQFITSQHYLYDLIYNPTKTTFLKKGEERGAAIKNGHEMLVIQAEESWRIWNE